LTQAATERTQLAPLRIPAPPRIRGTGIAEVSATGPRGEIGKIGESLTTLETEPPRLRAQTQKLVRLFGLVGGTVSVVAVILYGLYRGRRPARRPDEPLFSPALIVWSVLQGLLAFGLVGAIYVMAHRRGMPENEARALAFFSLVTAVVALIFVNRSFESSLRAVFRPNRALLSVLAGVAAIMGITLAWPVTAALLRFGPLHADDLAITVGAGLGVLVALELLKRLWAGRLKGAHAAVVSRADS